MSIVNKTSFNELARVFPDAPIVLFGSGNIADKTLRQIDRARVRCIVDNSTSLQGGVFQELDIIKPDDADLSGALILICSTAITDIALQLKSMGVNIEDSVRVSPLLNDLIAIKNLEELQLDFYFTSGTKAGANEEYGGGFYWCGVGGENKQLKRLYAGACYGAVRVEQKIYFVDTDVGIMSYCTLTEDIQHVGNVPKGGRAHGISYNEGRQAFFVTCSYRDSVIEYTKDFEASRELFLSDKFNNTGEPQHHCNDNVSVGSSLYVTMFSSTGNWKRDSFDGCIAEFDLVTGKRCKDVVRDLYMPHNVLNIGGSLHVLDSLPGHLRFGNMSVQGTFPAFTRGLAHARGYYLLGQSKNRNYSRVVGLSNNISVDCGVILFDPSLKVSRFVQFPLSIGEVHSIVV